nr:hypothetical protein [Tanacetum cinerariifolium]
SSSPTITNHLRRSKPPPFTAINTTIGFINASAKRVKSSDAKMLNGSKALMRKSSDIVEAATDKVGQFVIDAQVEEDMGMPNGDVVDFDPVATTIEVVNNTHNDVGITGHGSWEVLIHTKLVIDLQP